MPQFRVYFKCKNNRKINGFYKWKICSVNACDLRGNINVNVNILSVISNEKLLILFFKIFEIAKLQNSNDEIAKCKWKE